MHIRLSPTLNIQKCNMGNSHLLPLQAFLCLAVLAWLFCFPYQWTIFYFLFEEKQIHTWKNFELCFITVFGGPTTFNDAAIESSICISSITNNKSSTWQFKYTIIQKDWLTILLPPHKWCKVNIDFTVKDCTVSFVDRR